MSVDKFGRSLHIHKHDHYIKKNLAYGLLNITLKNTNYHVKGKKNIVYDLSSDFSVYEFPLEEGIIQHVTINKSNFQIYINDKLYKHDELLNIKLKLGDKISLESNFPYRNIFLEMIIKYPILTE